jgi:ATP-dependent Clp protease adaptor protein ClpS
MSTILNLEHSTQQDIFADAESALEKLWHVIIHNDDVTPFDFVIIVLRRFFQLLPPDAEYVTYVAHTKGQALVATLPLPEAQKRVGQAHFAASLEGYPLMFTIEPE